MFVELGLVCALKDTDHPITWNCTHNPIANIKLIPCVLGPPFSKSELDIQDMTMISTSQGVGEQGARQETRDGD